MVATPKDIAQASTATAATLLMWQMSMAEPATFRREMDQSRRAIRASRELLERLRQRHRNDMAQSWEDANPATVAVSTLQADVLRSAFRCLVRETGAPQCQWRELATSLVRDFTGCERIEAALVDWIVGK
ncbi:MULTISPECIES: nucleoside/nucleotide kinase family protein [unclassified Mesorhizobium]|uniref:hypothetical protein n=1 Tax=unclassified Mesorhizobium TaxID=325217 RepID=UPI0003CFA3A2|nr:MULTISPECIES: hypothetical protein [unclassified Mesorhizobium]ESY99192.1 hypothetical protein X736_33350 [Mesorhizobium sp. L2C089B000]WJI50149.1 hypothetical protein NLY44_26725 [Mesorhizobium sp. C089B]